jgi:hypothetical protein
VLLDKFNEFLRQVTELVGDPIIVETKQPDESLVALTAVRWAGNTHTALTNEVENPLRQEHLRALALALGQRSVLFGIAALAVQGAARLSLIVAMPANAVWMMPGIYKFITQVMDEYAEIRNKLGR